MLQVVEGAVALALAWLALHAPHAAPFLLASSAVIVIWALLADGPLGVARWVGLGLHRKGLIPLAIGLVILPVATGEAHDLEVLLPCLGAALALGRLALVRWPAWLTAPAVPAAPAPEEAPPPGPAASPSGPASIPLRGVGAEATTSRPVPSPTGGAKKVPVAQLLGKASGRAGRMLADEAEIVVPRGARTAGRVIGRLRSRNTPDQPLPP